MYPKKSGDKQSLCWINENVSAKKRLSTVRPSIPAVISCSRKERAVEYHVNVC